MTTVGIIGTGPVGAGCAMAMLLRNSCDEIVLLDKNGQCAQGAANDLADAALIASRDLGTKPPRITKGTYEDLSEIGLVVVTAGVNEREGGGINRADPLGRLRLLPRNIEVFEDVVPRIVEHTNPVAPIMVVTDPPDPLADVAHELAVRLGQPDRLILSTGTYLDSLRFRRQLAQRLGRSPSQVRAYVLGEHGKSAVYVWSSATVQGAPWMDALPDELDPLAFQQEVERAVRLANIDIIDGTGASQRGISVVAARIAEALLGASPLLAEPIGSTWSAYSPANASPTYSLPTDVTQCAVSLAPKSLLLAQDEAEGLRNSAHVIAVALDWAKAVNRSDHQTAANLEDFLRKLIR